MPGAFYGGKAAMKAAAPLAANGCGSPINNDLQSHRLFGSELRKSCFLLGQNKAMSSLEAEI